MVRELHVKVVVDKEVVGIEAVATNHDHNTTERLAWNSTELGGDVDEVRRLIGYAVRVWVEKGYMEEKGEVANG